MRLEEIVREWAELGKQDLSTARFLLTMRPVPLEIIGFLCQQAVEKHLKAFLIQNGQEPDKTHNLVYLLSCCQSFSTDLASLADDVSQLNVYAVKTRYPYPGSLALEGIMNALETAAGAVRRIDAKLVLE